MKDLYSPEPYLTESIRCRLSMQVNPQYINGGGIGLFDSKFLLHGKNLGFRGETTGMVPGDVNSLGMSSGTGGSLRDLAPRELARMSCLSVLE